MFLTAIFVYNILTAGIISGEGITDQFFLPDLPVSVYGTSKFRVVNMQTVYTLSSGSLLEALINLSAYRPTREMEK